MRLRQVSLRRSCLLPAKDELGKTIIVMLIVCTKVTKSILFVLLPQLAAAWQGDINNLNAPSQQEPGTTSQPAQLTASLSTWIQRR